MSTAEDTVRLRHMLDHAREAVALMRDKDRSEFDGSRLFQLALVSKEAQVEWSQIPWAQMIGMRNRLVHGYGFLDLDILWQTVGEDLPELIGQLERIVEPRGT